MIPCHVSAGWVWALGAIRKHVARARLVRISFIHLMLLNNSEEQGGRILHPCIKHIHSFKLNINTVDVATCLQV